MPRVAPVLASDAELAIVYRWLDGVEAVRIPLPLSLNLKTSAGTATGPAGAQAAEVELTVARADRKGDAGVAQGASLRLMLHSEAGSPVANQPVEYQVPGRSPWSVLKTDEAGEALLPNRLSVVPTGQRQARTPPVARLRVALSQGKYALVVEAINQGDVAKPVVIGIASAVLTFQWAGRLPAVAEPKAEASPPTELSKGKLREEEVTHEGGAWPSHGSVRGGLDPERSWMARCRSRRGGPGRVHSEWAGSFGAPSVD